MNCAVSAVFGPRVKSSTVMSSSGVPCLSSRDVRLNEMSTLPPRATTPAMCSSTAASSRTSSSVTSAVPPAPAMSAASASSGARVRPARKTRAPSRANVRATPAPSPPAP
jgi:hypothetical protein